MDDLKQQTERLLRTLRDASDQKAAIAWMRDAYLVMEAHLREMENTRVAIRFQPAESPAVYALKSSPIYAKPAVWFRGHTTVYPDPPEFVNKTRAWKKKDTLALEKKNNVFQKPHKFDIP